MCNEQVADNFTDLDRCGQSCVGIQIGSVEDCTRIAAEEALPSTRVCTLIPVVVADLYQKL